MTTNSALGNVLEHSKAVVDGAALAGTAIALLGWVTDLLGVIAATLAVIWWGFRIYGEPGFQRWWKRVRRRKPDKDDP
jgi:hypothetical protein